MSLQAQLQFPGFAGTPGRLLGGFCVSRALVSPENIAGTSRGESAATHRASLTTFLIRVESLAGRTAVHPAEEENA
jgi:hypothetical protein